MENLEKIAKLVRYYSILGPDWAGSGHPTSSLSATDLMVTLFFGGFLKFDLDNPQNSSNDRVIFSKGHASSLFYALYAAAGRLTEEDIKKYRKFNSPLEGHPSLNFKYTEAPTGSLGQGLSIGLGMALSAKLDEIDFKTYVLMGDSETSEGSVWEAVQVASHYELNNLIGIVDVNRLGQSRQTMLGHDMKAYEKRFSAFGWNTAVIDGHSYEEISNAYQRAQESDKPFVIIGKTIKGKGISFIEDRNGFHGKAIPHEKIGEALKELGEIDKSIVGKIKKPEENNKLIEQNSASLSHVAESQEIELVSTRRAYGQALVGSGFNNTSLVVLDGETSNSTFSEIFAKEFPERYFEMFIAEQNMAGVALGLAIRGKVPFVSTFSAFWARAHDQIRMASLAKANIKFCGSHSGVSIGEDGPSQMGIEDIAMFRALHESVVLYPCDGNSTVKLVNEAFNHKGLIYIRTTRMETPVIYSAEEAFPIGGSKIIKRSEKDRVSVVAAGITVHEALKAYEELYREGIEVRVIDLYSVKPIDSATLIAAAKETEAIIVVEDHRPEGGIGEAVRSVIGSLKPVYSLAVNKLPRSGKPEELLEFEEIDSKGIIKKVKEIIDVSN